MPFTKCVTVDLRDGDVGERLYRHIGMVAKMDASSTSREHDLQGRSQISSALTPLFKFGVAAALGAVAAVCLYAAVAHRPAGATLWNWTLPILPGVVILLWLTYWCLRLKRVVAYEDCLSISNLLVECQVAYGDIEELKATANGALVSARLRLREPCRFGCTVHFLLPSRYGRLVSQPEVQLLRERCPQLGEAVTHWKGVRVTCRAAERVS